MVAKTMSWVKSRVFLSPMEGIVADMIIVLEDITIMITVMVDIIMIMLMIMIQNQLLTVTKTNMNAVDTLTVMVNTIISISRQL